jgi:hypothetical protein
MEKESGEKSRIKILSMIQERQREYAINLRASIEEIKKTATESSIGRVEMSSKETIKRIFVRVMVKCTGSMAISIEVFGSKVSKMGLDS